MPQAKDSSAGWSQAVSNKLRGATRLFVLGIGNRQKGDDAGGCLCARLVKREMDRRRRGADAGSVGAGCPRGARREAPILELRVLDAGETPESVTGLIREFRPSHVLVIDAAFGGHPPGTIFLIDKKKIAQEDISTHRVPLTHLVRYLEETIGCRVILVGLEPQEVAWGKPVSAVVRAAAAHLAAWLAGC